MNRIELLQELARRVDLADARGDWQGREVFAAAWLRIHNESDAEHAVSGLARRIAAREAAKPLEDRIDTETACEGHLCDENPGMFPHAAIGEVYYCDGACRRGGAR